MNLDPNNLMVSVLLGIFGTAYFIYGKKQGHAVALITGIALMVFPYFVESVTTMLIIGVLLILAPLFIKSNN